MYGISPYKPYSFIFWVYIYAQRLFLLSPFILCIYVLFRYSHTPSNFPPFVFSSKYTHTHTHTHICYIPNTYIRLRMHRKTERSVIKTKTAAALCIGFLWLRITDSRRRLRRRRSACEGERENGRRIRRIYCIMLLLYTRCRAPFCPEPLAVECLRPN